MAVLLVLFVIVMFVIAGVGGDDDSGDKPNSADVTESAQQAATMTLVYGMTAQAAAAHTTDAIQAATAAEIARRTLTPPTAIPTSGPQMPDGVWFRVLPGEPIPTYQVARLNSTEATPLEADSNYRVMQVVHETPGGPWYQVMDNLGQETRWVSGPSLHQRIILIDTAGNPLPPAEQPLDVPPPGGDEPRATPPPVRTPAPAFTGTPGTPSTPGTPPTLSTPSATSRPPIAYGVENWSEGVSVATKDALDLCRVPDVTVCDMGQVATGEVGTVVEGPIPAGEHWWWKVEFDDGRIGWIAQVLLTTP